MESVRATRKMEAELLVTVRGGRKYRKKTQFQVTKPMAEWKTQEYQKIQQYLTTSKEGDDIQIIEIYEIGEE